MSALLQAPTSSDLEPDGAASDHKLVASVRRGDDRAFEALYERYNRRIHAYVYGMVKDHQRAEDVTQEVFVSALRRMRATERPIAFKPWVYEIAKNACIDQFRRSKRSEEVSIDADDGLAPSDYGRLISPEPVPDAALVAKQQLDDLCGAFGGLSEAHHEILVLRELEGLSYKQIGEKMGMSRPAVESTLFRARRRLTEEYDELASGQRCLRIQSIIVDASSGRLGARDTRRLARHVAHCQPCRRQAVTAGVDSALLARKPVRQRAIEKVASLFPIALLLRGRRAGSSSESWVSQLPMISDNAAAGGAKLAAVAALLLAGLGAGVSTQTGQDVPADRAGDRPARVSDRTTTPAPAGAATITAPAPAVVGSRSGGARSRGGAATRGDTLRRGASGERGLGTDLGGARRPAASERQSGAGAGPAGGGGSGTGVGGSGTGVGGEQGDSVRRSVQGQAPQAPQTPSTNGTSDVGLDLPSAPSVAVPQGSVDPVGAIRESAGALPQAQGVSDTLESATSGATSPVSEALEGLGGGGLPGGG